jgi:hypothetical protein
VKSRCRSAHQDLSCSPPALVERPSSLGGEKSRCRKLPHRVGGRARSELQLVVPQVEGRRFDKHAEGGVQGAVGAGGLKALERQRFSCDVGGHEDHEKRENDTTHPQHRDDVRP